MLRIAADGGNRLHAPEGTVAALVSAYTAGADYLVINVRATADGELVAIRDDELGAAFNVQGRASSLSYDALREIDLGGAFRVRGGAETPWRKEARPEARVKRLGALIDELPGEPTLIFYVRVEEGQSGAALGVKVAKAAVRRGIQARCVIASEDTDAMNSAKPLRKLVVGGDELASVEGDLPRDADGWFVSLGAAINENGEPTPFALAVAEARKNGLARLGLFVRVDALTDATQTALARLGVATAVVVGSVIDAARLLRPMRSLERASFGGTTEDAGRFHFGYAKANEYAHVYQDDGVHINIRPYDGPAETEGGEGAIERELAELRAGLMFAARDWPFYSGGGVGSAFPLDGDFVAEVDFESTWASQATMLEMAVTNVDPPKHRPGFRVEAGGERAPNTPQSFRDKGSFFDPHGAPPFVGVEHDEDDGFRINHNLGTEYDNNQYGRPLGDGKSLRGRLRLERRGPWFSAYYRDAANPDWVCVGSCRNDSMNRRVFLRCVGKRWRQERDDGPGYHPIPANHITFRDLSIDAALPEV